MIENHKLPTNLLEAVRYFSDKTVATEFLAKLRWPHGPMCPRCGSLDHSYLKTRQIWKCKACKRQYSVKVGTIFEDSPLGLDKWLPAVWLIANSKNGISSHELGRALGTTQKSAWFMLHRIRLAMQTGSFDSKIAGEVEVDETYVGGRGINMHKSVKRQKAMLAGPMAGGNKTPVVGVLARGGEVRAAVVRDVRKPTLQGHVRRHVEAGSSLFSDMHHGYVGLSDDYQHGVIDHAVAYVDGRVHTNGLENFWSLLKRGITGTYIGVAPCHLSRYLDERVFTFNLRGLSDYGRFEMVLRAAAGRRLTYLELTGH
jgi:transposase-like protein